MKEALVQLSVPLSRLVTGRRNPRQVKPGKEADRRLAALIRSQGLLQPLLVRPIDGDAKRYEVVAGHRRLRALREIHRGDGDPKIPCVLRDVDANAADAMSLGENFGREPMHPLDEAEAFAGLARREGKDAKAIAAEFGVSEHYVKQRIKLATLAEPVKSAYREGKIDTATAEAFAAVPEERQLEVWKEVGGTPRHHEHVRNVIANAWIDARLAIFDAGTLPPSAVSGDLFGDRTLVDRKAFMEAQAKALDQQRQALSEEGWREVVVGRREDLQDRLHAMEAPGRDFDEQTSRKLAKIAARRQQLEQQARKTGDSDEAKLQRLQQRYDQLEDQEHRITTEAPEYVSEETKAAATAFLLLDPDGRVHREYRIPRRQHRPASGDAGECGSEGSGVDPKLPSPDDLGERQLAVTFTQQALAVREALLKEEGARRRVLAPALHEKVRSEALSVRHEANETTLCAGTEGFTSPAWDRLCRGREKADPFSGETFVDDVQGYDRLEKMSRTKLEAMIDILVVGHVTAHLRRGTALVSRLAAELNVNVREFWRPDAAWLAGYQKIQLAGLIRELKGPAHAPAPERKKSELVASLDKLFADAADGRLEDKELAEKLNRWLPSNLRPEAQKSEEKWSESAEQA
jgi:ParB family chromosome partitioning protein